MRAPDSITNLFGIQYPIVQAGMIWCSGWRLASAVSNAGGLGMLGAGSMYPEVLRTHIEKFQAASDKPFAVNLPLLYPDIDKHVRTIIDLKVPVVFTSAGSPKTLTPILKAEGIKVVHVVSSAKFARKSEDAGVDAVVAEGFEAGGHNGREETTTMVLIPDVVNAVKIPVIAAGGIGSGRQMLAALSLGASAVQVGSRFAASEESSCHPAFKSAIIAAGEGDTRLSLKKLTPVRLLRNKFASEVDVAEHNNADVAELTALLGRGRAKKGMFEGDMDDGELEIGQVASSITAVQPAAEILRELWADCVAAHDRFAK